MAKPLSIDLRERIVAAVEDGGSLRVVGARFGVAPSSVQKITALYRQSGSVAPRPMGGDRRSQVIEAHAERIFALLSAQPDQTLEALRGELRTLGVHVGYGGLRRFLKRHGISFKKKPAGQRARAA